MTFKWIWENDKKKKKNSDTGNRNLRRVGRARSSTCHRIFVRLRLHILNIFLLTYFGVIYLALCVMYTVIKLILTSLNIILQLYVYAYRNLYIVLLFTRLRVNFIYFLKYLNTFLYTFPMILVF